MNTNKVNTRSFTIKLLIVIFAILAIIAIYLFAFPYKANSLVDLDKISFEANYNNAEEFGFVDGNELTNTEKLVAFNSNFELYLDETTTHFYVKDKQSGQVIESNPRIDDPRNPIGNVATRQKATIEYYSVSESGVEAARFDNYSRSIYHDNIPDPKGYRTYKIKEIDNGFQVYYQIANRDIDYLYFPLYLEPEIYEPILEDRTNPHRRALTRVYSDVIDEETGLYRARAGQYEGMTRLQIEGLYEVFYESEDKPFGEYSRERAIQENADNGYFEVFEKFNFEIAIQVTLNDEGFEITIIDDSIREGEGTTSKLSRVSIYPHLGTAIDQDPLTGEDTVGQLIVPDGSGAVVEFKNQVVDTSVQQAIYTKRFYGHDLANLPHKQPESEQDIILPLYGIVKEDIGFAAIITKGSAQASINVGISGVQNDSYNKIYPTFRLREFEGVILGAGWNTYEVDLWSRTKVETDYSIKYVILDGDDNNYSGIAKAYQQYLVDEHGFTPKDNTNSNKVVLELLGAFDNRKFFAGVPYKSMDTLTTFKQAELIVDEVLGLGVENIDILYNGINKEGLTNNIDNKVNISSKLGGKKGFKKLEQNLAEHNVDIYPTTNLVTAYSFNRPFDKNRYTSRRISGTLAIDFEYDLPTKLSSYETTRENYVIKPTYYETLLKSKNKDLKFNNLHLNNLGSKLTGSYSRNEDIFKEDTLLISQRLLENIEEQKIALNQPVGPLMPYANLITDLPTETSLYTIFDYSIPLVQLVLSGFVDYSLSSINMPSERDVQFKFLKAIETGSNLKYTLSHDNSLKLLQTDHNKYMSTEYVDWLETIENHNKVLNELGIHDGTLVGHKRVANNVFESTYSNGLVVLVNLGVTNVNVDGTVVPSLDFVVKEGI